MAVDGRAAVAGTSIEAVESTPTFGRWSGAGPGVPTEPIGRRPFLVRAGRRVFGVAVLGLAD